MTVFISGGCKNGKSYYAQRAAQKLAAGGPMYYIATMDPHDEEDEARIRRHIADRDGWGFQTLEWPRQLRAHFEREQPQGAFLLDSVTAVLSNEMFLPDGTVCPDAGEHLTDELLFLAERAYNIIFVSDYLYGDAGVYDALTEHYRRALAQTDRALARRCDCVLEISAGQVTVQKGDAPV